MNLQSLEDHVLVKQFIDGDQSSLEELIKRHKSRIYTYILLIVKNPHLAEDIFQDTFIKVIKSLKRGKYQDKGKFVSWVLRIAHNLIIDYYRKQKYQKTISNDDTEVDLFNSKKLAEDTIEDSLVQDQILSEVRYLMDSLPSDQRNVVYLRHYCGLSFKEIADQTGVSINTALGRMRYALINMRRLIEEHKMNLTVS
ncbi:MAG: sigma-70 family RNA polymerase sigma factor [Bacteroidetes bacterium]|nr:sigma-70 family RNA polymerase sigma factor [Bacteroidota bacterium]MBT3749077.1 sigma-70 family RNA polymerase sigma factor [Bacteroidota bacterium]MBT4402107.1 sigma-70 family RNA polymerase sigma factor [Bacteroidota bacterium]MBT4408941.1 sigma-70 family RNA polymerase sigma factor [Bacteroidota bacterium]MBT7465119.1 sigma-70 family RNA polymerase sigma factor [Bacteroidota bacterium]